MKKVADTFLNIEGQVAAEPDRSIPPVPHLQR